MINIVLCGGSGTRLWPLSRRLLPKQFIKLFDGKSLFQLTVDRNMGVCKKLLLVSSSEQYFLALDQLNDLFSSIPLDFSVILEPVGRNTAPAIALACFYLPPEEVVVVTPSDHIIRDYEKYNRAILRGEELAKGGFLVTFGIKPDRPETGYGYIEAAGEDVLSFKEKPDLTTANEYLKQNISKGRSCYYWNSGIFCFKAGLFLDELKKFEPEIYEYSLKAYENIEDKGIDISGIRYEDMMKIPEKSIDYAVMEKSSKIKVVEGDFYWSDLGSFESIYGMLPKDQSGNTLSDDFLNFGSKNNLVISDRRCIAAIDVEDLIIVDTADALLVAKSGSGQRVKDVVSKIKEFRPELLDTHVKTYRPWGSYEVLLVNKGYKIKKIVVKPGGKLSLQRHLHRNEHWIVVSGTATVTVGGEKYFVRPNESTYIKMGEIHRLENEGKIELVMIEVQVGEYTGEDDIVRVDDIYGR
ncbi:MAG: mannose-1-phosphate guanylyltransferase/mannose-6-phosphate isomerase [Calditerrivibrio sp.]|nr:mannose-1-phosphate guanylyltransferase/mannose-6-phosphate isomerase [Calditerrivibrio sp.]MCA1981019.1 mannose-1-phosphate guanylyltransferase/mannose-6-phosphate isomerase [Calditerrivibrio sp.]